MTQIPTNPDSGEVSARSRLRVLHLASSDIEGGAARGAYFLHKSMLRAGLDSRMFVQRKASSDKTVMGPATAAAKAWAQAAKFLDARPLRAYPDRELVSFSPGQYSSVRARDVNAVGADIVNAHWICSGFLSPDTLAGVRAPMVWTLRDMWGFTGGCHYSLDCTRYETECGQCPRLRSPSPDDLAGRGWRRKRRAWSEFRPTIVAISNWLADCARRSSLLGQYRVEVIHNCIDTDAFRPTPRAVAREVLGWDPSARIVLYCALDGLISKVKGADLLVAALRELGSSIEGAPIELVVAGPEVASSEQPDLPVRRQRYLGMLRDDLSLALVYAAADVTVVTSRQEAFGKVAAESLSCGTPVVCFDTTGLKDIVDHRVSGYRARCFESSDLAAGMRWVLESSAGTRTLGMAGRRTVIDRFSPETITSRYERLYQEILRTRSNS